MRRLADASWLTSSLSHLRARRLQPPPLLSVPRFARLSTRCLAHSSSSSSISAAAAAKNRRAALTISRHTSSSPAAPLAVRVPPAAPSTSRSRAGAPATRLSPAPATLRPRSFLILAPPLPPAGITSTVKVSKTLESSRLGQARPQFHKQKMAEAAAVRVIGLWSSPFVIRVAIALKLKGVEHEFVEEVVGRKSELLLRSNPVHKKIPVLLHHGKPVSESLIIVQYIDEVWSSGDAPAILPADPYARAVERFWAQFIDDKFPRAIRVLKGTDGGDKDEAAAQLSAALQLLEGAFVELSHGKHYFGGDSVGYLDIALVSYVGWVRAVEKIAGVRLLDEATVPNLVAWADRLCAHPAVVDAIPDADKFVEFSVKFGSFSKPINSAK